VKYQQVTRSLIIGLVLIMGLASCSASKMASDITSGIMYGGSPVIEQESDPYVAETSGLALLKTLEIFAYHNPSNRKYQLLLAKNYANYAFGFLENKLYSYEGVDPAKYEEILARTKLFYSRGRDYGLNLLRENKRFAKALDKDMETFEKAVRRLSRGKQEALFWTAFSWGGLINWSKDDPMAIIQLGKVERMMARAAELDNTYFYGSPHLFFGVYYGSRPAMLGGDLKKSKENFDQAINITHGRFFFSKVLYAQFYAVQAQDRALFSKLLGEVIAGDVNVLPEQRLANILAQQRAHIFLSKGDELFATTEGYSPAAY